MIYLIDGHWLAHRSHFGFSNDPMLNSRGENVGALYGVTATLLRLRQDTTMTAWAYCTEGPELKHRHILMSQYKQGRDPKPDDLVWQLKQLPVLVRLLGCPVVEAPAYEADDCIATLAANANDDVSIVTADKDLLSCIDERVWMRKLAGKDDELSETRGPQWVRDEWGVEPAQTRDVLALMGDATDNVPGVPGIGQKTAQKIIAEFGDIDALYAGLEYETPGTGTVLTPRFRALLREHREQVYLARELVTVCREVPLPPLEPRTEPDWNALRGVLARFGIEERLRRFLP